MRVDQEDHDGDSSNRADKWALEWDCCQLLVRFYDHFDRWNYAEMVALFAVDGVWHRAGKVLAGHEAIVAELKLRSTTQKIRHVLSNLLVDVRDPGHADVQAYLTVYRHDDGKPSGGTPAVIASPAMLLLVKASLVLTPQGWRIAQQVMQREFEFSA